MAHLIGRDDRRDRGQIILVTAFALAVTFVSLALILNSVIYTENLATRSETSTASKAVTHQSDVRDGVELSIEYVNEHNASSHGDLVDNLSRDVDTMAALALRHRLSHTRLANADLRGVSNGTTIRQTNGSRNFTSDGSDRNWTAVENAHGVRDLRIHVTDAASLTARSNEPVNLSLEDADGDRWNLTVYDTGSDFEVEIENTSDDRHTCGPTSASDFWINVSAGTFAGTACEQLEYRNDAARIERVDFTYADNAEGTYRFVANTTTVDPTPYGPDDDGPFTDPAIYGARINVSYETNTIEYETDLGIVPGGSHD